MINLSIQKEWINNKTTKKITIKKRLKDKKLGWNVVKVSKPSWVLKKNLNKSEAALFKKN